MRKSELYERICMAIALINCGAWLCLSVWAFMSHSLGVYIAEGVSVFIALVLALLINLFSDSNKFSKEFMKQQKQELDGIRHKEIEELKKRVDKLESELEQCTNKK